MIKKFFSIFLLTTSMVSSVISATPLRVTNNSTGEISHVALTFSYGILDSHDNINVTHLKVNQTGTTDFADEVHSINLHTVLFFDANGTEVVENLHGKTFYLPVDLTLDNVSETENGIAIHITDNNEARTAAEEAKLLHQVAVKTQHLKEQIIETATTAKNWVVGKPETTTDNVQEAAAEVASVIENESKELADVAEEIVTKTVDTAEEIIS
jgi:hypothetical protein